MDPDKWSLPTANENSEAMGQNTAFLPSVVQVEYFYHSDGKAANQVMSPALHRLPVDCTSVTGCPYTML